MHDEIEGSFKYDWRKVRWDDNHRHVTNTADGLSHGIDGDMPIIRFEGDNAEYLKMFGPFGEWEIRLSTGDHEELDRANIKAIYMDFHILGE